MDNEEIIDGSTQLSILLDSKHDIEEAIRVLKLDYDGMKISIQTGSTFEAVRENTHKTVKELIDRLSFLVERIDQLQDTTRHVDPKI
jgi:chaperonin cofactor prefoldin